jgi:NAD(P)H dehydrogenase (quinone)
MHALVVTAHPDIASLSHAVARTVLDGVISSGHSAELADLAAEGFDPRFTQHDLAVHRREVAQSPEILAEQARLDRADALVLVYPVYWWSMPALLKGWIERVFANGWAYDEGADLKLRKKLQRLPVHLIAIGGADMRTYARHGYFGAMRTQIDHGIFDYCGAPVLTSELLVPLPQMSEHLDTARAIGAKLFQAARVAEAA